MDRFIPVPKPERDKALLRAASQEQHSRGGGLNRGAWGRLPTVGKMLKQAQGRRSQNPSIESLAGHAAPGERHVKARPGMARSCSPGEKGA